MAKGSKSGGGGSKKGNSRDAGTGKFVTKEYAEKHKKTTVTEAPKKKGK